MMKGKTKKIYLIFEEVLMFPGKYPVLQCEPTSQSLQSIKRLLVKPKMLM